MKQCNAVSPETGVRCRKEPHSDEANHWGLNDKGLDVLWNEVTLPPPTTGKIPLNERTQRFYQGVAIGSRINEEHADVDFPDDRTRLALFYFYAGALAAVEHGCKEQKDFEPFLLGLQTRAPQAPEWMSRLLTMLADWDDEAFFKTFGFERESA
jgi:hypothetical protein